MPTMSSIHLLFSLVGHLVRRSLAVAPPATIQAGHSLFCLTCLICAARQHSKKLDLHDSLTPPELQTRHQNFDNV